MGKKSAGKDPIYRGQKNPVLAAVLSLLWPGLGQAYNGQYVKAVLVMIIELGGFLLYLIPTIIAWIYSIIDAYYSGKKMIHGDTILRKTNVGYMVVFAIIPILLIVMGSLISAGVFHKTGLGPSPFQRNGVYSTPYPTSDSYSFSNSPSPTLTPVITPVSLDQIKNSALIPPYTTLFKNINSYKGKVVYFRGKVLQLVSNGNNQYDLRIGTQEPDYNNNVIYVHYAGNPMVIEDEIVDVWGTVNGVADYNSVSGTTISIPEVTAIDIVPYATETGGPQYALLPQTYANPSDLSMTVDRNPTYGFSIQYPAAWDKQESYDSAIGYYLTTFSIQDTNDENLATFSVYASPDDIQPEQAYLSVFNRISGIPNVVIQPGTAELQLDNNLAYRFDYSIKDENNATSRKGFVIATVIKKKAYILAFEAKTDYYDTNYSRIQSIVDSFTV